MESEAVDSNYPAELLLHMGEWQIRAQQCGKMECWYELYFGASDQQLEPIGGGVLSGFFGSFVATFQNENGYPLSSMSNPRYTELVGGLQAHYLGYAVLSGYSTFYIFRDPNKKIHIVLANGKGIFRAHVTLSDDELNHVRAFMTAWINSNAKSDSRADIIEPRY